MSERQVERFCVGKIRICGETFPFRIVVFEAHTSFHELLKRVVVNIQ